MAARNRPTRLTTLLLLWTLQLFWAPELWAQSYKPQTEIQSPDSSLAENVASIAGCPDFEDRYWDELYKVALNNESFPSTEAFHEDLISSLLKINSSPDNIAQKIKNAAEKISLIHELLTQEALAHLDSSEGDFILEQLTALELGDRTNPHKKSIQEKRVELFREAVLSLQDARLKCLRPASQNGHSNNHSAYKDSPPALRELMRSVAKPVFGSRKTLATAYQSCSALRLFPVSRSTSSLKGIRIVGRHPSGRGYLREISDLSDLQSSHYYLKDWRLPGGNCFDTMQSPLIYDFGGKPRTTADENSTLDLFRNAGTGSAVLGTDCSGFIYSALATAGLKLKKEGRLKAIHVHGISAAMYRNPQSNGLNCFKHAAFNKSKSLEPGDLLATNGHIVMVDMVGPDPFRIHGIRNKNSCKLENIRSDQFDFTVMQSSPYKNALGIQLTRVSDYLKESPAMKRALELYAVEACKARFSADPLVPKNRTLSVIRHTGDADCFGTPVRLEREECLESCSSRDLFSSFSHR